MADILEAIKDDYNPEHVVQQPGLLPVGEVLLAAAQDVPESEHAAGCSHEAAAVAWR